MAKSIVDEGFSFAPMLRTLLGAFALLGVLSSFLLPPFQAPQESAHWSSAVTRSYRIAGFDIPPCTKELALESLFSSEVIASNSPTTPPAGLYARSFTFEGRCRPVPNREGSFASYPGVTAALILRFFTGESPLSTFYLARILGGSLVIGALAMFLCRAQQSGRRAPLLVSCLLAAFCLSPLVIQQSFSVGTDSIMWAITIMMVSYLVVGREWHRSDWIALAAVGFCAALTKPTLLPLFLAMPFVHGGAPLTRVAVWGMLVVCAGYVGADVRSLARGAMLTAEGAHTASLTNDLPAIAWELARHALTETFDITRWLGRLGGGAYVASSPTMVLYYVLCAGVAVCGFLGYVRVGTPTKAQRAEEVPETRLIELLVVVAWGASLLATAGYVYLLSGAAGGATMALLEGRHVAPFVALLFALLLRGTEHRALSVSAVPSWIGWVLTYGHWLLGMVALLYGVGMAVDTLAHYH